MSGPRLSAVCGLQVLPTCALSCAPSLRSRRAPSSKLALPRRGRQSSRPLAARRGVSVAAQAVSSPSDASPEAPGKEKTSLTNAAKVAQRNLQPVVDVIRSAFKTLCQWLWERKRMAVAVGLAAVLVLQAPAEALAAKSGGRVGGRSFSHRTTKATSNTPTATQGAMMTTGFGMPFSMNSFFFPSFYMGGYGMGFGGGGLFGLLLFAGVAVLMLQSMQGLLGDSEASSAETSSVIQIQVGLLGLARSLQRELDAIAMKSDTGTPGGLHYVLTETVLALLRHPDYCVYGRGDSRVVKTIDEAEQQFNAYSVTQRGKFGQETLVNVDARRAEAKTQSPNPEDPMNNEYIVVTLVVSVDGRFRLNPIGNSVDLNAALQKLASVPEYNLQAVEVLWTPQEMDDTLSQTELLTSYPEMKQL